MNRILGLLAFSLAPHFAGAYVVQPGEFPKADRYLEPSLDFNRDGFADFVVVRNGAVILCLNAGVLPPRFEETVLSSTSRDAALVDIDGDDQPEVVVLGGDATTLAAYEYSDSEPSGFRTIAYFADIGSEDTLVPVAQQEGQSHRWLGVRMGGNVAFLLVDTSGQIHNSEYAYFEELAGSVPQPMAFGDYDGDGDVDYANAPGATGIVYNERVVPRGYVQRPLADFTGTPVTVRTLSAVQHNNDSPVDILFEVDGDGDQSAGVVVNPSDPKAFEVLYESSAQTYRTYSRDFDRDGDGDRATIVFDGKTGGAFFTLNNGENPPEFVPLPFVFEDLNGKFPADVDGDGDLDVVISPTEYAENPLFNPQNPEYEDRDFTFDDGEGAWMYGGAPGFVTPPAAFADGKLTITLTDNKNSFGFWTSEPIRMAGGAATRAQATYSVDVEADSDVNSSPLVPTIRIRASSSDFQQTETLVSTSQGDGSYSPTAAGKVYPIYFGAPAAANAFQLSFDVLNFGGQDAANAIVGMRRARIQSLRTSPLAGTATETLRLDFQGDARGFTPRTAEPLLEAPAIFAATARGLEIQGKVARGEASTPIFGFWGRETDVLFEPNTLYRVSWIVETTAEDDDTEKAPAFRLRINDGGLKFSQYSNIESTAAADRIPTLGNAKTFEQFILTPAEISGQTWNFAFDYLLVPPPATDNDPSIRIILKGIAIDRFPAPAR